MYHSFLGAPDPGVCHEQVAAFMYFYKRSGTASTEVIESLTQNKELSPTQKVKMLCAQYLVKPVIDCLEKWFRGIDSGEAQSWYPSPDSQISQQEADELICKIDDSFSSEIKSHFGSWSLRNIYYPPEFHRLEPEQRRALAEELNRVIEEEVTKIREAVMWEYIFFFPDKEKEIRAIFEETQR